MKEKDPVAVMGCGAKLSGVSAMNKDQGSRIALGQCQVGFDIGI